jgi:hypothetical protein
MAITESEKFFSKNNWKIENRGNMTREEINEAVKKWSDILWLHFWNIEICYKRFENLDVYSEVTYQPQYMNATVYFPIDCLERVTEKVIIHELVHIAIAPLAYVAEDLATESTQLMAKYQKEFVTTHLTNVFNALTLKKD